ncbi:MAG: rod shape-determining protein MreC [Bacteroidales bacterium]|nr:rod shape-determining protein MreC [Bacteroidales bacterium]
MRNLFSFLLKNYFFFLFLFLEIIATVLIVNNNYFQRSVVINATNEFTGSVKSIFSNVTEYFFLKQTNKILSEENSILHALTEKSYIITDRSTYLIDDTVYKQQYTYVGAGIISNSIHKRNNYLMLNKGVADGVNKDMAVISPKGIVGIIRDVSKNFSSVISVLHKDAKISAKIKKNNYIGTMIWKGIDYRTAYLMDIPTHVKLTMGDTIITSGFSHIFPEGIMIGVINNYTILQGENFYTIKLKFSEDYNSLSYVYIVNNLMKNEQIKLETESQDE